MGDNSGSREPSPAVSALTGFDPGRVVSALTNRLTIYRGKRDMAEPFAEPMYNRQEAYQLVVEALDYFAHEAGLSDAVPAELNDD